MMCLRECWDSLLHLRPDAIGLAGLDAARLLVILELPDPLLTLRAIRILYLKIVDGGGRMARADSKPLALLPPNVLCASTTERHAIAVSINVACKAVGLVEAELGRATGAERHFAFG